MTSDFKSKSCFSGVLAYPGLADVGEFGSDAAILPRFLLVAFLRLPFAILLSLSLLSLADVGASCEAVGLYLQHWMAGFPLSQISDVLPSSWVPLEP